jgi:site-specific DNA-methyltransferase (adenine-specific)
LVIADPPFGIDFDGKSSVYNRDEHLVIEGYEETSASYHEFTTRWVAELPRIMKPESSAYVFSGWTNLDDVLQSARNAGLVTLNHLIWHYPFGVYTKKRFVTSHYHIVLLVKNTRKYFFNKIENYPEDVWSVKRQYRTGLTKNATKLPLEVVSRCIDFSSKPGDIVLDPFMGNGTTAVAAKLNFRRFIGFEINEKLRPLLENEIDAAKSGESYIPYSERLATIEELSKMYPKAYREYIRREKEI